MTRTVTILSPAVLAMLAMLAMLLTGASPAWAKCGPGPLVTMDNKGIVLQSIGATTNAILLPTQTLAITSGTSGCSNDGLVEEEYEQELFVAVNFGRLSGDIARGQGGYLDSLAELMGCERAAYPAFAALAQTHLEDLLDLEAQPRAAVAHLRSAMTAHPVLGACTRIS